MASVIYDNAFVNLCNGNFDIDAASGLKIILTTSGYTEDRALHTNRSQVTSEVATGNGYTAGGVNVTGGIAVNTTTHVITLTLTGTTWTTAAGQTLTARKAVWSKNSGTNTTDWLVAVNDFGSDQIASNGGTFTLPASTITLTLP